MSSSFSSNISHFGNNLWVVLFGTTMCLSITSLPLGMGLTTNRVAFLLIFTLTTIKFFYSGYRFSILVFTPLLASVIAFFSSYISYSINDGNLWPVISWLPIGVLGTLIAFCSVKLKDDDLKYFTAALLISIFLLILFTLLEMKKSGILFSSAFQIRRWYSSGIESDANRYMNIMFYNVTVCLIALYARIFKTLLFKFFILFSMLIALYMIVMQGSRQNLIAIFFSLFLFYLIIIDKRSFYSSSLYHIKRFLFITTPIISSLFLAVKYNFIDAEWLKKRFLSFLIEQSLSSSDESRINTALHAFNCSFSNGGLGIGPGNYMLTDTSIGAHNGYLLFLAENGIIFGGIALFFMLLIIIILLIKCKANHNYLSALSWSIFLTIMILLTNLKDLFREPIFWATYGLSIGLSIKKSCNDYN